MSAFPELDLSKISMDAPETVTPARNIVTDDDDGILKSQLPPKADSGVVLAQPAVTPPPAPVSKIPVVTVDAETLNPRKMVEPLLMLLTHDFVYFVHFKNNV